MPKQTSIPIEDKEEIDKISKLVPKIFDEEIRMEVLYKFQHETPHNIELCAQKLNDSEKWREEHGINNILEDPAKKEIFDRVITHFYFDIHKYDNDGRPVVYFALGKADIKEIYEWQEVSDHKLKSPEHCKEVGVEFLDSTLVIDMEGMSLLSHVHTPALPLFKSISSDITDNFPGNFNMIYIINAPWSFRTLYTLITPFMSQTVKDELLVFGGYEELKSYIPLNNIPLKYGGGCHCPIRCLTNIEPKPAAKYEEIIPNRDSRQYYMYVPAKETLFYSFTNSKDTLDLKILFIPEGEQMNVILNRHNILTHKTPCQGSSSFDVNGTCLVLVTNNAIFSSVPMVLEMYIKKSTDKVEE